MIAFPSNVHVWLAMGRTEMRRGMNGLAPAHSQASDDQALIAHQQLQIGKLRHELYVESRI